MSTYARSTIATTTATNRAAPFRTRFRAWCRVLAVGLLLSSSAAMAARTHVVAWGGEVGNRMLDIPYSLDDAVAMSVPYILRANGDVIEIGTMPPVVRATNAKAISASGNCLLVLHRNGTVEALSGAFTCQTSVPADLSGVLAIATSGWHALALTSDGHVRAWGNNSSGQTDVPAGLQDVVAIAAGSEHSLALRSNGQVVAWGGNYDGQLDIPADLANVVAIDVGGLYNQALKSDGTVVAWGDIYDNPREVPLDLPPARALGAGKWRRAAVVLTDGTVREWGFIEEKPLPAGLDNVLALSMGYTVNFALVAGAITPGEALAEMRLDLNRLIAIDDVGRAALNGYLDQAAEAVRTNQTALACEAIQSFATLVATPGVVMYTDRVVYFAAQSRDVFQLMHCGRWRDA